MRSSLIVKHFTLSLLVAFFVSMLTGCGENEAAKEGKAAKEEKVDPNIEIAKKAVFPADKSRTLGEAVSANFNDVNWKTYKNDQNQQIVEFAGTWKHGTISHEYRLNPGGSPPFYETQYFVNSGNKVTTRFVVNKDQTVEFVSATVQSHQNDLGSRTTFRPAEEQPLSSGIEVTGGNVFLNKVILHK